jgi:hypothetical protein
LEKAMSFSADYINQLFKTAADGGCGSKINPVTGGRYVPGLDSIRRQKMLARRALEARARFAEDGPPDAQPLPTGYHEREDRKMSHRYPDRVHYIVALFARSLEALNYDYDTHPKWYEFACGVMASPYAPPERVIPRAEFGRRFPPRNLPGLGPGCYWDPAYLPPSARKRSTNRKRDRSSRP